MKTNTTITTIAPIAATANYVEVYAHPAGHPHRPDLLAETISKIILKEGETFHRETVDLGRIIGKDHLVETKPEDCIVYLRRGNRAGETRMALKEAVDTSFVTIVLCVARKDKETPDELVGKWVVVTLFEGQSGEKEPWDNAFIDADIDNCVAAGKEKAEAFWATHALVPTDEEAAAIKGGEGEVVITPYTKYGVYLACLEGERNSFEEAISLANYLIWEEGESPVRIAIILPTLNVGRVIKVLF